MGDDLQTFRNQPAMSVFLGLRALYHIREFAPTLWFLVKNYFCMPEDLGHSSNLTSGKQLSESLRSVTQKLGIVPSDQYPMKSLIPRFEWVSPGWQHFMHSHIVAGRMKCCLKHCLCDFTEGRTNGCLYLISLGLLPIYIQPLMILVCSFSCDKYIWI